MAEFDRLRICSAPFVVLDEFEEWPQVVLSIPARDNRFLLDTDAQILCGPDLLTSIHERFGLPSAGQKGRKRSETART
jgi:hypothetical protein